MALLYAAVAYLLGVVLARWWWESAGVPCQLSGTWWLLSLALLPLTPLLNRWRRVRAYPPLRWPEAAGFVPPGQPPAPALFAALLLCLGAGFLRYGSRPFMPCWGPGDLAFYNLPADQIFAPQAQPVTVAGTVAAYPLLADGRQELEVAAETVMVGEIAHAVTGGVRVATRSPARLHYGQAVLVSGRMAAPGELAGFSYKDYLAIRGVHSVMVGAQVGVGDEAARGNSLLRLLYAVRAQGEALINRSLPEPYAALANGMLLGIKANIPEELYAAFTTTGTSHVIVISGTNVALISGVIVLVTARLLGKRRAWWPALVAIACYALLVGGDAAVLRAAVMGGLFVTAAALDRRSTAFVSLAAACLLMTLANPLALWDIGLQMSSMGTLGLVLLTPILTKGMQWFWGRSQALLRLAGEDVLAVTLGASLATLPLVLYYFGQLSLVSIPANLLIAPVQPLILLGGSAALLLGTAGAEWGAQALLWLPWIGLAWTVAAVRWCAGLPWAAIHVGDFGLPHITLAYAALALLRWHTRLWSFLSPYFHPSTASTASTSVTGLPQDCRGIQARSGNWLQRLLVSPAALVTGAVLAALLWAAILARPDGRLHVWFLDVGQGDGIFIQTPGGRQVLIDGGAGAQALLGELGAVMPFWDRDLDLVVLTHPDADHMAAQVEAANRFAIGAAWETPASAADPASATWRAAVEAAGAEVQLQAAGGWAELGDGVALWVLSPTEPAFGGEDAANQNSLVTRLVYGDFSALLTGDAGAAAEARLTAAGAPIQATVLKVAHHGSKFSTGELFVAAVNPALAVIQVGENRYGHPDGAVLDRLAGRSVLRTDVAGRIEVISDGRQVWVEKEEE